MKSFLLILRIIASIALVGAEPSHNPVVRVVDLLKSLSAKIENEGKAEEALYENFVCWAQSVITGKTASNEAAESKISQLEQQIADLDSGKTELTTERVDLEKEIKTLKEDQESASNQRAKDKADFEKAETDMKLAIEALKKAIEVLETATKAKKDGSLLNIRAQVSQRMIEQGLAGLERQATIVNRAVELGNRMLDKADASFLRRLLTGDVPTVDWKKLNRKATFKMSYKARSVKIQETLASMLKTFETNLKDAQEKEADDIKTFDTLMGTKGDQLKATEADYAEMSVENGAKALSREEASNEKDDLTKQIESDQKFIQETQDSLNTKKAEWKARKELRAGELSAISQAISILHSDDARDLFKKSFKSQGYLLVQETDGLTTEVERVLRLSKASAVLTNLASVTKDDRLLAIAPFSANETAVIKPAINAIDMLIAKLKDDETADLQKKEQCEAERASDTREAILKARLIDEKTDAITGLNQNIEELDKSIAVTAANMEATQKELDEATAIRKAENAEYLKSLKEDQDAAALVKEARGILQDFYTKNKLMLAQVKQPVAPVAGEAPPPPPPTWEGAYMGATSDSTGILAILQMVLEDIEKDISKAKSEEKAANAEYLDFKQLSTDEIKSDTQTITSLKERKADKVLDKSDTTKERATAKGTLTAFLSAIAAKASGGCDYFAVNYKLRVENRQIELDGLTKAKAYLQGGEFDKTDANRELKPGDAAADRKSVV